MRRPARRAGARTPRETAPHHAACAAPPVSTHASPATPPLTSHPPLPNYTTAGHHPAPRTVPFSQRHHALPPTYQPTNQPTQVLAYAACGVCGLGAATLPWRNAALLCAMGARVLVTAANSAMWIAAPELYPTHARHAPSKHVLCTMATSTGLGVARHRLAAISSPRDGRRRLAIGWPPCAASSGCILLTARAPRTLTSPAASCPFWTMQVRGLGASTASLFSLLGAVPASAWAYADLPGWLVAAGIAAANCIAAAAAFTLPETAGVPLHNAGGGGCGGGGGGGSGAGIRRRPSDASSIERDALVRQSL